MLRWIGCRPTGHAVTWELEGEGRKSPLLRVILDLGECEPCMAARFAQHRLDLAELLADARRRRASGRC